MKTLAAVAALTLCSLALAQTLPESNVERTVQLGAFHTPQDLQEIATVLRTVADIRTLTVSQTTNSISFAAPVESADVAEWLVKQMDRTPQDIAGLAGKAAMAPEHSIPSLPREGVHSVRVFYLAHNTSPLHHQELMTVLRTVERVQKIFNYSSLNAFVVRGTKENLDMVAWTVQALDQQQAPAPDTRQVLAANAAVPVVRILYLPSALAKPMYVQETLTQLRTVINDLHVFNYSRLGAIVVGGTDDQLDHAARMVEERNALASR